MPEVEPCADGLPKNLLELLLFSFTLVPSLLFPSITPWIRIAVARLNAEPHRQLGLSSASLNSYLNGGVLILEKML